MTKGRVAEAYSKGKILAESDCIINEFGTRRRRSYKTQDLVVDELIKAYKDTPSSRGRLVGTSNVRQRFSHALSVKSLRPA
jgi:nicotinate phosphoribosyltransferase